MWQSYARWNVAQVPFSETTDEHETKEQAEGVVTLLKREGFGGEKKFFPIEAGVRYLRIKWEAKTLLAFIKESYWENPEDAIGDIRKWITLHDK